MGTFIITMTAGLIACMITTIGIIVINKYAEWAKEQVTYFISFAAGVLIAVSFMHLIPESMEMNASAPLFLLGGFFSMYMFNRFLKLFVCEECDSRSKSFGIVPALGIGLHSFIDGIIYSVTFKVSIFTGVLSVIGLVLHEFPEGIVTYILLAKSGFSKKKSSWYAFLAAGLTTPLGALVSWPFIRNLTDPVLGILLSISAGALIYVGASHLLPEVEAEDRKYSILALAAGIIIATIITISHGHL